MIAFIVVVGVLTLTPGLDTALIVRTAATGSRRQAWGVVAGIQTGTLIWGALTSAGVSALLTASQTAYEVVRWVGFAYLLGIGAKMLWSAAHRSDQVPEMPAGRASFGRGLLTNLLNPKMGVFYAALLPQFIPPGANPLLYGILLAGVHVLLGTLWSAVLVTAARTLRHVLRRPAPRRLLDALAGTVIIGFGVRLATAPR